MTARRPLFAQALGETAWAALPEPVRAFHSATATTTYTGRARITRGGEPPAHLAAWFFGFPAAAEDAPIRFMLDPSATGETWTRDFDGRVFRSRLTPATAPGRCRERIRGFAFDLALDVDGDRLRVAVAKGSLFGLPLPRALLPLSESWEYAQAGRFHFDIALYAPFGLGLIVRYAGWLAPDAG